MTELATIRGGDAVSPAEYRALLEVVGWRPIDEPDVALRQALETTWNVTARTADGRLIGLARVLDDGMLYASVWDVLVARFWQRHGIGRALMVVVLERTEGRRLVALVATKAGESLYRALGFTECSAGSTALFLRPDSSAPDRKGGMPDG